jgi:hypothetical protein
MLVDRAMPSSYFAASVEASRWLVSGKIEVFETARLLPVPNLDQIAGAGGIGIAAWRHGVFAAERHGLLLELLPLCLFGERASGDRLTAGCAPLPY